MYHDCRLCFTSILYTKELTNNELYIRKKIVISKTNRPNSIDLCVQFKDFFFSIKHKSPKILGPKKTHLIAFPIYSHPISIHYINHQKFGLIE